MRILELTTYQTDTPIRINMEFHTFVRCSEAIGLFDKSLGFDAIFRDADGKEVSFNTNEDGEEILSKLEALREEKQNEDAAINDVQ